MSTQLLHSFLVITAILLAFVFSKSALSVYDLQVSAFLFLVLFVGKKTFLKANQYRVAEAIIFSFIITTIVNTTGGLSSPFFFLLYFLLFAIGLFLEPISAVIITITLILFFFITTTELANLKQFLPLLSLALLTPFSMYLGQEYEKERKLRVKIENLKFQDFMFLSVVLKNHLKSIIQSTENFMGDHELDSIQKNARRMETLIDEFEKET